jgi:hypothetical protein
MVRECNYPQSSDIHLLLNHVGKYVFMSERINTTILMTRYAMYDDVIVQ